MDIGEHRRGAGIPLQVLWAGCVGVLIVVAVGGLAVAYVHPEVVAIPELLATLTAASVPPEAVVTAFALPIVSALVLVALVGLAGRSDPMALLFSLGLLGMFVYTAGAPMALRAAYPAADVLAWVAELIALEALAFAIYLFPTGRFVPGWMRWILFPCAATVMFYPPLGPAVRQIAIRPESARPGLIALTNAVTVILMAGAIAGQFIRYRRSPAVERQQIAWVLLGISLIVIPATVQQVGVGVFPGRWTTWTLVAVTVGAPLVPVCAGVAIFRFRLYDLSRMVRRTVMYAILTASLGGIYLGIVITLSQLTASGSNLEVAAATLAVAALFSPLRRRLQAFVDRRFNRSHINADAVAADLSSRLKDLVDPAGVIEQFSAIVAQTIEPVSIAFWLPDAYRTGDREAAGQKSGIGA